MLSYVIRRVLSMVPVMAMVLVLAFILVRLIPGDPALLLLGPDPAPEQVVILREALGLDQPLLVQLAIYVRRVAVGDFGDSIMYRLPVGRLLLQRAETSVILAAMSMIIVVCLGIPAGIIAGLRAGTWVDQTLLFLAMLGISLPVFWMGLLLIMAFAVHLGWFPTSGYPSVLASGNLANLRYLVLPAITLGYRESALVARMTRSCLLETLREDYISTARAKGLSEARVIRAHALRNAAIPVLTVFSLTLATLVAGTVVTETVFALPGVGRLLIEAVSGRDYPLLQGLMVAFAGLYLTINLLTDLAFAALDPRIQYQ